MRHMLHVLIVSRCAWCVCCQIGVYCRRNLVFCKRSLFHALTVTIQALKYYNEQAKALHGYEKKKLD